MFAMMIPFYASLYLHGMEGGKWNHVVGKGPSVTLRKKQMPVQHWHHTGMTMGSEWNTRLLDNLSFIASTVVRPSLEARRVEARLRTSPLITLIDLRVIAFDT